MTITITEVSQTVHITAQAAFVPSGDVVKMTERLEEMILNLDLFTKEQKEASRVLLGQFRQFLDHPNKMLAPKTLAFLAIKVFATYTDNRLIPILRLHRELLRLVFPEGYDIDAFMERCEDQQSALIERKALLALFQEMDEQLCQTANDLDATILADFALYKELVQKMTAEWKAESGVVNGQLKGLYEKMQELLNRYKTHAVRVKDVGAALVAEHHLFQSIIQDLQRITRRQ